MKKCDKDKNLEKIICNCCGKEIPLYHGCCQEAFLSVAHTWGYFSEWDGCRHSFEICGQCYGKMIQSWAYPPDSEDETELL